MITNLLLYISGFFVREIGTTVVYLSRGFHLWPQTVLDGFTYFCQNLMKFNIIVPIDQLFIATKFLIAFFSVYVSVRLVMKVFNYVRGTGPIDI